MANSPSINREPASDSSDDVYMIPDSERYKIIEQSNYETHQKLGQSIPQEKWRVFASLLLQANEVDAVKNKERVQYMGLEVLNVWMEKPGSTIWVLKDKLDKMKLYDTRAILDKALLDHVTLYIAIHDMENKQIIRHTKNVPGGKPLLDVIRPIVNRTHGFRMTQREKILNLRLVRSTEGDQDDVTWSSPAKHFKAVQVDIHKFYTNASDRPQTEPAQKLEGVTRIERNVISWVNEGSLCFGYVDPEPASVSREEELVYPVQEKGLVESMDSLSLKSDTSLEGQGLAQSPANERRKRTDTEADGSSDCPGFRITGDPTTDEMSEEERPSQQSC